MNARQVNFGPLSVRHFQNKTGRQTNKHRRKLLAKQERAAARYQPAAAPSLRGSLPPS
jgi:hypothetical protein